MSKVVIVGGGPAGMIAAIASSRNGNETVLLEKNEKLGKKLFITGKGRCNLTNASDMQTVMNNVVSNSKFLFSSFKNFTNADIMELIEEAGCPLKVERGERVFPESDHSSDVIRALSGLLRENGVRVRPNTEVKSLDIADGICYGVKLKSGEDIKADRVIVATGGLSYSSTGSTGDGLRWAERTGHDITPTGPSLVPLILKEKKTCSSLMGLSLKNVTAYIYDGPKEIYSEFGEMLFTHFGASGPIILSASAFVGKYLREGRRELKLKIDLKPALDEDRLDMRIRRDFEENINKTFRNSLGKLLPASLIPVVISQSGINENKRVNEITKEERASLVHVLKGLAFTVTGTSDYNEAIITQGGISVKDINPQTMESKKIKNLSFAGEVLDLDALTGGYNLQIAWSTGYAAGNIYV